jgi:hypothetical protein
LLLWALKFLWLQSPLPMSPFQLANRAWTVNTKPVQFRGGAALYES